MRNKDRIRPFCERLATAWERCPDLRFGQLIVNAYASELDRDPFYVEDEKYIQMIEAFVNTSPYYATKKGLG